MFGCFSWNFHFRVAESCVGELCRFDGYRERIIPLFDGELSGAACCVSNTEFSYWNSGISNCRLCLLKIVGGFSSCSVSFGLNHVNPPVFGWSKKTELVLKVKSSPETRGNPYVFGGFCYRISFHSCRLVSLAQQKRAAAECGGGDPKLGAERGNGQTLL